MLRTFAAALLATTLVAGSAFAAEPAGSAAGTAPAAGATVTPAAPSAKMTTKTVVSPTKPVKTVKHIRKHSHKRVAANIKAKTHKGHVARSGKPAKVNNGAKKAA
jgi:hypothetical protein